MPAPWLPAEQVTRRYGKWRRPDEDKAATAHRAEHAHHDFLDVRCSRIRELKELGTGLMIYFYFLRWMAILFALLALMTALPNMALSLSGKFFNTGNIELTTLGNFGRVSQSHNWDGQSSIDTAAGGWQAEVAVSTAFMSDASLPPATSPFNKAAAITAMSVLDLAGCLLYFGVTLGLIMVARRLAHEADTHTITIHDYSIRVQRLPQEASRTCKSSSVSTSAQDLQEFFSQYGEVVHVEMVRAYGSLLRLVMQRGQLMWQLQLAIAGLQREASTWPEVPEQLEAACYKIRDQLEQVNTQIEKEQSQADIQRIVGAFVTFKDEAGKLACLKAQPRSRMRQWWSLKPEHKLFAKHALHVTEAPEPSDLKYEHLEHGSLNRFARSALVFLCSYTGLAVGFVLISLASAMRFNLGRVAGLDAGACAANCRLNAGMGGALGLTQADRELYASCKRTGLRPSAIACEAGEMMCYKCYCFAAVTGGMLDETGYCSNSAIILALEWCSQIMIVVVILAINYLLAASSRALTRFERHHTRSSEARSLAKKLFLVQFLNSGLSTIIASAHLPFLAGLFDGTALGGLFFQGIYTDLTPNWYKMVGRSLVVSQFVAALLRIFNLASKWAVLRWRYWRRHECLTQHQLEEALRGHEFELETRYGEHLNVIFVSLLLSGGLPVTYLSAAFWFTAAYWCDKAELLRLSRRPITYSSDLSEMVMNLLPYAAVCHAGFALWAFSLFGLPRSALITNGFAALVLRITNGMARLLDSAAGITPQQAAQRLLAADSAHLLVLLIVLLGVLFAKINFDSWRAAGRWALNLVGLLDDDEAAEETGVPEFPLAARTQLLVGEASYAIQDQPSYAAAFSREQQPGDMMVQVVLKQGAQKLAGTAAAAATPRQQQKHQHQLQQSQQQQQLSPRAASGLSEPVSPPSSSASYRHRQQQQQQQQPPPPDEPPSSALARSQHQGSRGESASQGRPASGAASCDSRDGRADEVRQFEVVAAAEQGPMAAGAGSLRRRTPDTLPQRFRQARASQVLPIPDEYLQSRGSEQQ